MAYGYIPSPFGGKPSSLDIAKAKRITPLVPKGHPVDQAKVTPQGRARNVSRDKKGKLPYGSNQSRTYTQQDAVEDKFVNENFKNKQHDNDLRLPRGDVADITPEGRSWNQFLEGNPDRSNRYDYDDDEFFDDDEDFDPNEGVNFVGKENKFTKADDPRDQGLSDAPGEQEVRNARKTPHSRAFNQAQDKKENRAYSQQEIDDKSDRVQAYQDYLNSEDAGPTEGHESPGIHVLKDPGSRADANGRSDIWGIEREYVGRESLDKSWDKPSEERNAMRTPYGRAEVAEGGPARTITVGDRLDRIDAIDDRRATQLDADVARARKTPVTRAVNQGVKRMSDLAGGERIPTYRDVDQEVSRAPSERFSGVEGIYKSEDESIDKSKDEPLEERIATRTPRGRAEAVTREENPVLSEYGTKVRDKIPDPYSVPSENTRLATHQDAKTNEGYQGQMVGYDSDGRAKRQKMAGNEDRTSEDESFDKAKGEERYAMRTPYGRARAAEGHYESTPDVPREESRLQTREDWDDVDYYDTQVTPRFKDGAYRDLQNEDTGFWTPDELAEQQNRYRLTDLSATTPKGRERSQRIAGGNVDRTGYEAIPGDSQVYHSTYEGDEIVAKSESAPIHKSIQTPIRDLIKKRREWK